MTCPTPSVLATHMRYRHTTERPLACQVINFVFGDHQYNFHPYSFASTEEKPKLICDLMLGSIIPRFVDDQKITKGQIKLSTIANFLNDFLNCYQGEHFCKEPGCDFTCRAPLTLARHQVLSTADL